MDEEYEAIVRRAYDDLVTRLRREIPRISSLPRLERRVSQLAVAGRDIHDIAQKVGISEDAIWRILASVAGEQPQAVAEEPVRGFEGAGLGADTDPGVTGGYGETGFGGIGNEPEMPVTEEPLEERRRRRRREEKPKPPPKDEQKREERR